MSGSSRTRARPCLPAPPGRRAQAAGILYEASALSEHPLGADEDDEDPEEGPVGVIRARVGGVAEKARLRDLHVGVADDGQVRGEYVEVRSVQSDAAAGFGDRSH